MSDGAIVRGHEAKRILDSEVYRDAWEEVRDTIIKQWESSADPREREDLHKEIKLINRVRSRLYDAMYSGKKRESKA